eukprot:TRINITY_DN2591_c0_g1_i1.p1 TRINITY_DN2591_c0_g1~~TRINITY_DN2591_c0_g1_i1.p1  ORF type:complete len:74 (+),score=6.83 TRINITY_DN2591_c0_g1_i1:304-525(+)
MKSREVGYIWTRHYGTTRHNGHTASQTEQRVRASLKNKRQTPQDTTRCCYYRRSTGRPLTTATNTYMRLKYTL